MESAEQQHPASARQVLKQRQQQSPARSTQVSHVNLKHHRTTTSSMRRAAGLLVLLAVGLQQARAQFLFTYEINQESDDSRAPKSSLFDPSSFKIVTPSQLQSSYQKLSGAPPDQVQNVNQVLAARATQTLQDLSVPSEPQPAAGQFAAQPAASSTPVAPAAAPAGSSSFLKQTSAALQSFAELFSLAPSSSPAPLGSSGGAASQQQSAERQAEALSLHEHWTQQQQKAHTASQQQQPAQSAFQSFTTSLPAPLANQQQPPQQPQQAPTSNSVQSNQPAQSSSSSPQASYWLTANPLNAPDGNFLVEIKSQQQQQQPQQPAQSSSLIDNLLSLGQPQQSTSPSRNTQLLAPSTAANLADLATGSTPPANEARARTFTPTPPISTSPGASSSFLATPTSYYPNPTSSSSLGSGGAATQLPQPTVSSQNQADLHHQQARSLVGQQPQQAQHHRLHHQHQPEPARHLGVAPEQPVGQLRPPVNAPENFNRHQLQLTTPSHHQQVSPRLPVLKSAEESLLSFRQQQQRQHDNQNSLFSAQQQLAAQAAQAQAPRQRANQHQQLGEEPRSANELLRAPPLASGNNNDVGDRDTNNNDDDPLLFDSPAPARVQPAQAQQPQPQSRPLGEIPKVSPQIYESFLLQQRDQHEKHLELLKQQQELNKLLEQKQKQQSQQQAEVERRKRKKEELERQEQRKKQEAAAELEAARKARADAEEARRKQAARRKLEEEERRRRVQAEEEERRRKAAAAVEEARKYRELLEAEEQQRRQRQELEAKRRQEAAAQAAAAAAAAAKAAEEAQQRATYARQRELDLKKLLELKQREEEQARPRQQQVTPAPNLFRPTSRTVSSSRATPLETRQRSSWGTPLRLNRLSAATSPVADSAPTPAPELTLVDESSASTTSSPQTSRVASSARSTSTPTSTPSHSKRTRADEKLIRQKIPLYSGAGKYGLYRTGNESLDLAALLDSVTLPQRPQQSTTSTTAAPAPASNVVVGELTPPTTSLTSSLSPTTSESGASSQPSTTSSSRDEASDDVPRRRITAVRIANHHLGRLSSGAVSNLLQPATSLSLTRRGGANLLTNSRQQRQQQQPPTPLPQEQPKPITTSSTNSSSSHQLNSRTAHIGLASLPADSDNDGIPGRAGVEYPTLGSIPSTSFSCSKQPLNGYYADTETACQVVHLCQGGVQSSILCPNGTIFNQEKFSCQWWYEVNCSKAPIFYQLNDNLYKSSAATDGKSGDDQSTGDRDINKLTTSSKRNRFNS